ncbi:MAG: SDR family oxidoreductase [Phycisphaeraceae bacterium]|nr:SDR family oxidoreductase [Phycisphaeraceae bacterium]
MKALEHVRVTGAGGGIGSSVAERCLQEGCHVILVDRNSEALKTKFGNCLNTPSVTRIIVDLEKEDCIPILRAEVDKAAPFISAAAFCHGGCVVDSNAFPDVSYWEQNYRWNVISCVHAIHACAASLRRGQASVVITGSVDAIMCMNGAGPYDAAKAAQLALVKSISRAYAPDLCAINVLLGTVSTDVWRRTLEIKPDALTKLGNTNLAGRVVSPQEAAGLIWLLCQEEAKIMRGQTVVADNGWSYLAGTFKFDERSGCNNNDKVWGDENKATSR